MKKLLLLIIIGLILSCNQSKRSTTQSTDLLPSNTEFVLKINNITSFSSDLKNNAIAKLLTSSETSQLNSLISDLEELNTSNEVIAAFVQNNYSLVTKYHDSLFRKEIDTLKFYHKIIDSIAIISRDKALVDQFKLNRENLFNEVNLANSNSSFSVYLNAKKSSNVGNSFFNSDANYFGDWTLMDFNASPDQLSFGAVSKSSDTLIKFIDIFKNTVPQENKLPEITPLDSRNLMSLTYDDFNILRKNLAVYNETLVDSVVNYEILETFSEIGKITLTTNEEVLIAYSIDALNTNELLHSNENIVNTFRNIDIYKFENPAYFQTILAPLIAFETISHYTFIDNFFVFATNEEALKNIISNFLNGTVLSKNQNFLELKKSLSDESSLLVVANPVRLRSVFFEIFGENIPLNQFSKYQYSGFQLVQDDGFVHINGNITRGRTNAQRNSITEEFSLTLDAEVLNDPQFVINHRTKQKEIVIQDINNNLYLISNKGKVLWKKQLNGPVLGTINQVDLYKNGRLQLAFATPRRLYILDRNGRDVSPFPVKFNNNITQPLSVFDYDNNKNYRFGITQNNVLLVYNSNGRRLSGFKYQNTNEAIVTQPKHFRINGRDYIVFATANEMKILNRRGESRIKVNERISFSGNPIFYYNNLFTTTSKTGALVQVNLKGQLSNQSLNLINDHHIDATSKTLALISENKLTIKQRTQELDFGNYTQPKIFYINDKIYVTLTDLQAQKIHLFDSQSREISNFPVYGNSIIDLANIDGDNNLEFVTKGESNSIILYQKN